MLKIGISSHYLTQACTSYICIIFQVCKTYLNIVATDQFVPVSKGFWHEIYYGQLPQVTMVDAENEMALCDIKKVDSRATNNCDILPQQKSMIFIKMLSISACVIHIYTMSPLAISRIFTSFNKQNTPLHQVACWDHVVKQKQTFVTRGCYI